jgi:hypothetical protein
VLLHRGPSLCYCRRHTGEGCPVYVWGKQKDPGWGDPGSFDYFCFFFGAVVGFLELLFFPGGKGFGLPFPGGAGLPFPLPGGTAPLFLGSGFFAAITWNDPSASSRQRCGASCRSHRSSQQASKTYPSSAACSSLHGTPYGTSLIGRPLITQRQPPLYQTPYHSIPLTVTPASRSRRTPSMVR